MKSPKAGFVTVYAEEILNFHEEVVSFWEKEYDGSEINAEKCERKKR